MTADAQGNDLEKVKYVVTSKIKLAPYDPSKALVAAMIAAGVKDPFTTLADIFADGSFVGLITSDGAPQDARDSDDAIEFHQPGYSLNADPSLTLAFTVAEDNDLTRELTIGKPDANGVYHVKDTIQDTKWFAYQETVYKSNIVRRRLGVIQITGNEPAQDTRGEVSGLALTAQWQIDSTVDAGNSRYLQSYYDPANEPVAVEAISLTPATADVKVDADVEFTVAFTPTDAADQTYTVESSDTDKATVTKDGLKVTVHGVTETTAPVTVTVTSTDGAKTAAAQVNVLPKA
ncbi:Ig-like domain-containing protein [Bifidobacterium miconisargentati]|uniref:Ig-like domain-containing protein n=1 Tax=Bifidobacterium miconisargentati TaxID=2834437 RepID=UPI001BDC9189|nr:Ig-like domain-containing protein [Bifidobacterium miconisargentati]MBW3090435.1 Ig-like domain-containing protein [Bifidobacterium miconisargentati]